MRDVLVTSCAGIVDTVYVPPVPGLWQLSEVQQLMRTSCSSERGLDLSFESFYEHNDTWAAGSVIAVSKIHTHKEGYYGEAEAKQVDALCSPHLLRNLGKYACFNQV